MPRLLPADRPIDILVVGEANADVVVIDADPHPVFGQAERIVREIRYTLGSSSVITACAAARLGLRVAVVSVVGDDAIGRQLLEWMRDRSLDVSAVRVDAKVPTGASVVLSNGHDRAILTALGTIGEVTATDVSDTQLSRARHLHIGSWFLQRQLWVDGWDLLRRARDAGLTISVDPNWDPDGTWDRGIRDILPLVDVFLPNATEAGHLAGVADVRVAARALAHAGCLVVIKRGADGALAALPDGTIEEVDAYPVEPVDTTGAGDAFDAGFLAAWLDGRPLIDALHMGVTCGGLSTLEVGGVDGQPTGDQVRAALEQWPS